MFNKIIKTICIKDHKNPVYVSTLFKVDSSDFVVVAVTAGVVDDTTGVTTGANAEPVADATDTTGANVEPVADTTDTTGANVELVADTTDATGASVELTPDVADLTADAVDVAADVAADVTAEADGTAAEFDAIDEDDDDDAEGIDDVANGADDASVIVVEEVLGFVFVAELDVRLFIVVPVEDMNMYYYKKI
jgi:hypothetical protein